jgi:hypothetical protein
VSRDWREVDGFTFIATIASGEDGRYGPIETSLFSCDECGTVVVYRWLGRHSLGHEPPPVPVVADHDWLEKGP